MPLSFLPLACLIVCGLVSTTTADDPTMAELEADNPVRPIPGAYLGHAFAVTDLPAAPDPERARLGRWLFFDTRLLRILSHHYADGAPTPSAANDVASYVLLGEDRLSKAKSRRGSL